MFCEYFNTRGIREFHLIFRYCFQIRKAILLTQRPKIKEKTWKQETKNKSYIQWMGCVFVYRELFIYWIWCNLLWLYTAHSIAHVRTQRRWQFWWIVHISLISRRLCLGCVGNDCCVHWKSLIIQCVREQCAGILFIGDICSSNTKFEHMFPVEPE